MAYWRKLIPVTLVALTATACVHADMVSTYPSDAMEAGVMPAEGSAGAVSSDADHIALDLSAIDLEFFPKAAILPEANAEETAECVMLLDRDRGSLEWCLYALMGFGLCKSAPLFRKISFGFVPEWYHTGGPYQIGSSSAVGPDCLCSAAVCFVQPDSYDADSTLRFGFVSDFQRSRPSQRAVAAHPSRGPPSMS